MVIILAPPNSEDNDGEMHLVTTTARYHCLLHLTFYITYMRGSRPVAYANCKWAWEIWHLLIFIYIHSLKILQVEHTVLGALKSLGLPFLWLGVWGDWEILIVSSKTFMVLVHSTGKTQSHTVWCIWVTSRGGAVDRVNDVEREGKAGRPMYFMEMRWPDRLPNVEKTNHLIYTWEELV